MFTDDKSIENIQQLFAEFKKFLVLQKEYTKLELTEKLTILLSTLIMILVLTILGMVALFYLLFALAYILEPLVGGLMVSFGIIAGINVLLIAIIYFFRRQLIISPMVNFLATTPIKNEAMNNSTPTPKKITLEDIAQRKQEVLQEICDQKQAMADTTRRIFAPLAPAASGGNALMRSFSTGMAIFDGVMLGMKMIRKVRGLFRKRY